MRSGTPAEKKHAQRIAPVQLIPTHVTLSAHELLSVSDMTKLRGLQVLKRPHWLLVTLLLVNAAAMEALPIFLDRLVSPTWAIVLSVTAVLFFGEPSLFCHKHDLQQPCTPAMCLSMCCPPAFPGILSAESTSQHPVRA